MWLSSRHRVSYSTPCVAQLQTQSVLLHPLCGSAPDTVSYSTPCVAQLQSECPTPPLCGSAPDRECPTPPLCGSAPVRASYSTAYVAQLHTSSYTGSGQKSLHFSLRQIYYFFVLTLLLWKTFSHTTITSNAQRLFIHKYPPLSIAR